MGALFDQLRVVGGGVLCGAAFMLVALAFSGAFRF